MDLGTSGQHNALADSPTCRLTLRLIWVPSNAHCHITGIRCRVEESFKWTSPKTGGPAWRFDSYKIPILDDRNISAKFEPVSLGDSTMLACHYRVRFPDDETISPTTLPFTKTPMEVSHELITELTFYDARTGIRRERRYQRPLTLVAVRSLKPSTEVTHTDISNTVRADCRRRHITYIRRQYNRGSPRFPANSAYRP